MSVFQFKQFAIRHQKAAMKVGTDSVLLGCLLQAEPEVKHILDVGTGSGLLAIMMAQRFALATIDAVEIDRSAAEEATLNMKESPWSQRLCIYQESFQAFALRSNQQYDLIVSNPPYYVYGANTSINDRQRESARHQSELSFTDFLTGVHRLLKPGGSCWIILPKQEGELFIAGLAVCGFELQQRIAVYPKVGKSDNRVILRFGKGKVLNQQEGTICIYNADGSYTDAYYEATQAFLLWKHKS